MTEENKKDIANKRRSRTSTVNYINKLFTTQVEEIRAHCRTEEDLVELVGFMNLIEKKLEKVNQLSHEITEDIQDAAKYEEETESFMDAEVKLFQNLNQLSHFIKSKQQAHLSHNTLSSNTRNSNISLPKLNIKKFNGDAMEWQCFYDSFIEAIHNNVNLSDIEK